MYFLDTFLSHLRHVGYELRTVKSVKHPFYSTSIFDNSIIFFNMLLNILPAFAIDTYDRWSTSNSSTARTLKNLRRIKGYFDRLLCYSKLNCEFVNDNILTVYNR